MGTLCGLAQFHLPAWLSLKIRLYMLNVLIIFPWNCFLGHLKGRFLNIQWGLAAVEFGTFSAGICSRW